MTITTRFGRKLKVPSTFQIKHQLLLFWLKDQLAKEEIAPMGKDGARIFKCEACGHFTFLRWQAPPTPRHSPSNLQQ